MDFEQIEDGMITQLKTDLIYIPAGSIKTYAGELQGEINEMLIPTPSLFIMYAGSAYSWVDGQANFNEVVVFTVMIASKNLRGNESVRKDTDTGCYRMIKDVLMSLTNKTFNLPIERFQPVATKLIVATKIMAIYGIDFKTNFDKLYG